MAGGKERVTDVGQHFLLSVGLTVLLTGPAGPAGVLDLTEGATLAKVGNDGGNVRRVDRFHQVTKAVLGDDAVVVAVVVGHVRPLQMAIGAVAGGGDDQLGLDEEPGLLAVDRLNVHAATPSGGHLLVHSFAAQLEAKLRGAVIFSAQLHFEKNW